MYKAGKAVSTFTEHGLYDGASLLVIGPLSIVASLSQQGEHDRPDLY